MTGRAIVLAAALAAMAACGGKLETDRIRLETSADTIPLEVELADGFLERMRGLMGRSHLPEGHGMLFLFPEPQDPHAGFWMYRTSFPLDVAYLDAGGRILSIRTMEPCGSRLPWRCPGYPAGAPFSAALEVPGGYLAERGVDRGDRVVRGSGPR